MTSFFSFILYTLINPGTKCWFQGYRVQPWRCIEKAMSVKYIRRFTANPTGSRRKQMTLPRKGGDDQGMPEMILKRQMEVCQITKIVKSVSKCANQLAQNQISILSPKSAPPAALSASPATPSFQGYRTENLRSILDSSFSHTSIQPIRKGCYLYLQNISIICWLFTTCTILN